MADNRSTYKKVVEIDATQAESEIIRLGGIASDTTKTLTERRAASNQKKKEELALNKKIIDSLEKKLSKAKAEGKSAKVIEAAQKRLTKAKIKAARTTDF